MEEKIGPRKWGCRRNSMRHRRLWIPNLPSCASAPSLAGNLLWEPHSLTWIACGALANWVSGMLFAGQGCKCMLSKDRSQPGGLCHMQVPRHWMGPVMLTWRVRMGRVPPFLSTGFSCPLEPKVTNLQAVGLGHSLYLFFLPPSIIAWRKEIQRNGMCWFSFLLKHTRDFYFPFKALKRLSSELGW